MAKLYIPEKERRRRAQEAVERDNAKLHNIVYRCIVQNRSNEHIKTLVKKELGWPAPSDELIAGIRKTIKEAEEKMPDVMARIRAKLKL